MHAQVNKDGLFTGVVVRTPDLPEKVQADRPNTECLTLMMCAACMGDHNTLQYLIDQGGHPGFAMQLMHALTAVLTLLMCNAYIEGTKACIDTPRGRNLCYSRRQQLIISSSGLLH